MTKFDDFAVKRDEITDEERAKLCGQKVFQNITSRPAPMSGQPQAVRLEVQGLSHIPAIKNSMFSIVKKENREWKRQCVKSFVSQLLSECPMGGSVTSMQDYLHSKIVSLPQDDNWKIICEIKLTVIPCGKGDEGATIEITPIT